MTDAPWLTIVGLGEDGPDGFTPAMAKALVEAEFIMGPARHLALLPEVSAQQITWPVPFAEGIAELLALRGQRVVALASGDPFWFGAGSVLARHLEPDEWRALPGSSCFSLVAAEMGWALEETKCLALHAAPATRLRPHLAQDARLIVTLRDGEAVDALTTYLTEVGFAQSDVSIFEALGGPMARRTQGPAAELRGTFAHPVCAAVLCKGGAALPRTSGLPDECFENDGQITKAPIRAMTLAALAPRARELLWDIGGGSGSIAIEWLLADPMTQAITIEADPGRADRIARNAANLGVDRLQLITGRAPEALAGLSAPDAVFIGGGLSRNMLDTVFEAAKGARLVANAVTLESEALLVQAHAERGGTLHKIALSQAEPLGSKRGWSAARPIVQWSITL